MKDFIKITEDNFNDYMEKDYENFLSDRVETFLIGYSAEYQNEMEYSLINCESPIEQLLAISLESMKLENINVYNPYVDVVAIEKQKEINIEKNKYRVDFYIPVIYKNQETKEFIVECDGYEFHQKTKQQVEEDNIRHRELQKKGFEIIRFSGTEIYHRPQKCALEIKNIILSKCKYKDE